MSKTKGQSTFKLVTTNEIVIDSPVLGKLGLPNGSYGTMRVTKEILIENHVAESFAHAGVRALKTDKSFIEAVGKLVEAILRVPPRPGTFGAGFNLGEILSSATGSAASMATMPTPPPPRPAGPTPIRPDPRKRS